MTGASRWSRARSASVARSVVRLLALDVLMALVVSALAAMDARVLPGQVAGARCGSADTRATPAHADATRRDAASPRAPFAAGAPVAAPVADRPEASRPVFSYPPYWSSIHLTI